MPYSPTVQPTSMGKVFGFHRATDMGHRDRAADRSGCAAAFGNIRSLSGSRCDSSANQRRARFTHCRKRRPKGAMPPAPPTPAWPGSRNPKAKAPPLPPRVRLIAGLLAVIALVNFPDALLPAPTLNEQGFSTMSVVATYRSSIWPTRRLRSPAGALSDRWPRARVYAPRADLLRRSVYIGLAVADTGWISVLLLLVYGGFAGITDGVERPWISSLCPPDQRGHAQGTHARDSRAERSCSLASGRDSPGRRAVDSELCP